MTIKTMIVEDEPVARRRLRRLLTSHTEIQIVAEAADGKSAVSLFRETQPDLLFLDVQMPGLDGFEVLQKVAGDAPPVIIFTTAYHQHAVRAFEFEALDYLLKPFDRERFQKTLDRAKKQIQTNQNANLHRSNFALHKAEHLPKYDERILIKTANDILILKIEDIDWVEAAGDYMKLHAGKETYLLRETMQSLEAKFDPQKFLRIQRSIIVNVERIKKFHPLFRGEYVVVLRDGTRLMSSRNYRDRLQKIFGKSV